MSKESYIQVEGRGLWKAWDSSGQLFKGCKRTLLPKFKMGKEERNAREILKHYI